MACIHGCPRLYRVPGKSYSRLKAQYWASFIIYTRENYLAVLPLTFLLLSVQGKSEIPDKFKIRCNFIYFAPDASIISWTKWCASNLRVILYWLTSKIFLYQPLYSQKFETDFQPGYSITSLCRDVILN